MALKIIFDANPLVIDKSGVGYYTQNIIQSLASNHPNDVELVGYYFNFAGRNQVTGLPTAPNIKYHPITLMPGKVLNGFRRLGMAFPLQLVVRENADIVLSTNFVPTLKKKGAKQVVAIYDLSFVDVPQYTQSRNLSFLQKWVPKTIKNTDLVITISNFTKERIKTVYAYPEEKICVTPIPPTPHVASDPGILKKLELNGGYVLFLGTIEPRKNLENLTSAYAMLPRELQAQYPLVLAGGKGWNDASILNKIAELQKKGLKIIQPGRFSDAEKAALYEHATLFVLPSHYEGFGMPVLEAMSYNVPVLCSNIPVLRETAGNGAGFFEKDDITAIEIALNRFLSNQAARQDLIQSGQAWLKKYPTWPQVAEGLYQRLANLK